MRLNAIEMLISNEIQRTTSGADPAHDYLHFKRVVNTAKNLCSKEGGKIEVVMPAAWLHDFVIVPKNDPRRSIASKLSADKALTFLETIGYPSSYFGEIAHAIEAHSFSANIEPETLEAKIVQDSDRLDGLGAIGIARCFATSGLLKRSFYSDIDPFCELRTPDDQLYTVDHFYAKLLKTAKTLKTESAKVEGRRRVEVLNAFLNNLQEDIASNV